MKKLTVVGLSITIAWALVIAFLLFLYRDIASKMQLNEWGDFLGGTTAPLALIWVVIGYFLQGDELRLNTEALKAQQDELKRQVEETATLAKNSERQAHAAEQLAIATKIENERISLKEIAESQPLFKPVGGYGGAPLLSTYTYNTGASVKFVSIRALVDSVSMTIKPIDFFEEKAKGIITYSGATSYPFDFIITYTDKLGTERSIGYTMLEPHRFIEK